MVGTFQLLPLPNASASLRGWCHGRPGEVSSPHRMVPFWYPSVVIWREYSTDGKIADVRLRLHGPQPETYVFAPETSVELIGIAIDPEQFGKMWNVSNAELAGYIGDWSGPSLSRALGIACQGVAASVVAETMADAVTPTLVEQRRDEISYTIALIRRMRGTAPLRAVRERVDLSERYFRTQFKDRMGISAKGYSRLLRANALVANADRSTEPNLADLSYQYGYFDQAHLTNDLRQLTGRSPRRLLLERRAESSR